MKKLPASREPLVVRTDFRSDRQWALVKRAITAPTPDGLTAHVGFVDDAQYAGAEPAALVALLTKGYQPSYLFVADAGTFASRDRACACVSVAKKPRRETFRVVPAAMAEVENNLSTSNTDWESYADNTDAQGVYRGLDHDLSSAPADEALDEKNAEKLRTQIARWKRGELYLEGKAVTAGALRAVLPDVAALPGLTAFSIGSPYVGALPGELGLLGKLESLAIHGAPLRALPPELFGLKNLRRLTLSSTKLTALPDAIGRLVNLRELDLSINQLERLPAAIGALTELTRLVVGNNKLTELPDEIGALRKLEALNAQINQLERLPATIGALTELRTLDLYFNRLTKLPSSLGRLRKLEVLNVNSNQLEALPATVRALKSLESIDTNHNPMTPD